LGKSCTVIGIAGGSASGKTTLAQQLVDRLGSERANVLTHDCYYLDHSELSLEERATLNYDHPDAFDRQLFHHHLNQLTGGRPAECPLYDFTTHTRSPETTHVDPKPILIIEGILVLQDETARDVMNIKVFVDTDSALRLARRLRRDCSERGRTLDSVLDQYFEIVRPMHKEFVEPSKQHADIIVTGDGLNEKAIDALVAGISDLSS
jgi:uridine kinase